MVDADSIIAEAEAPQRTTVFEAWLTQDAAREELFWDVMTKAREQGKPFARVFRSFLSHFPDAPKFNHQSAKGFVDARLADR